MSPSELAHRLAEEAEAVCRHYLSNGRRVGRYWIVGDVRNTPGRSMFVRLKGPLSGPGAVGKWTDGATGEHGDLLDIIREACGLADFRDVAEEARQFLSFPHPPGPKHTHYKMQTGSADSARRLFAMSTSISGTLAETYLRGRAITHLTGLPALRFHARCFYRPEDDAPVQMWPALIAAVTDLDGTITGVHRTWLDPHRAGKAPIATPRRAMGHLLGNAVRLGIAQDVLAAGEGIETMLSLRDALPDLAMAAALSANHLAAMLLPVSLRVLYVVRDADAAGDGAATTLTERAQHVGIEARTLSPILGDFNDDLRAHGLDQLRSRLGEQLMPELLHGFSIR
ncbi:MAG: toprim domain-containing protein [Rudaea sp.]|nr:toprim domain-containing protein [Rudaea sp.]